MDHCIQISENIIKQTHKSLTYLHIFRKWTREP
jgi:hypothetical protein